LPYETIQKVGSGLVISESDFETQKIFTALALFEHECREFSESREFFWAFRAIRLIGVIRVTDHHFD